MTEDGMAQNVASVYSSRPSPISLQEAVLDHTFQECRRWLCFHAGVAVLDDGTQMRTLFICLLWPSCSSTLFQYCYGLELVYSDYGLAAVLSF